MSSWLRATTHPRHHHRGGRRFRLLLAVMLVPATAHGQETTVAMRVPGATLSGVVRDSIVRAPLAGAIVQLVSNDSLPRFGTTATADSMGQFTLGDVPMGRYVVGFFHPILDSLGIAPTLREIVVAGHGDMRVELATPAPDRLRAAMCAGRATPPSGVLIGAVRDARTGEPARGATVTGEWLEFSFATTGVTRRTPRLIATTGESGFFVICNVPSAGTMLVAASKDDEDTDTIEVQVPASGIARRDLYLGAAGTVTTVDSIARVDSLGLAPRRVRVGNERLSGSVTSASGQPLANAHVRIVDGPQANANERGEWSIVNAPVGTRVLEVRAVGYYPERRPVNVIDGAPPVRFALATLKSVLDTVKVTASRLKARSTGFDERRRSGAGKYLTAADIARRAPHETWELFRNVSGVRIERDADGFSMLLIRGVTGGWCQPSLYLDGMMIWTWRAEDVDDWVRPDQVAGIEIYSGLTAPPQFQAGFSECGSILIWKK